MSRFVAALFSVLAILFVGAALSGLPRYPTHRYESAQAADLTPWTLVWGEEFNGPANTGAGTTNWQYATGHGYGPGCPINWGTGEIESMSSSVNNVYINGAGVLAIKPIREGNAWTSGRIETVRSDFQAPPGGILAVEISLQLPDVSGAAALGYWPAAWLLGSPYRSNCLAWPRVGEIDIMENVNGQNSVLGAFHCGVSPGGPCGEPTGRSSGQYACADCKTAFHTYRIELDRSVSPQEIRWYLDGVKFHTVILGPTDADAWADATNHGFFIILNVAMGGALPGAPPTISTASGSPMLVDYVHVYTRQPVVADTTAPVITSVATTELGKTRANITWTTNEAADSHLEFDTQTAGYGQTAFASGFVTEHSLNLSGLISGTTYHFRVKSKDESGNMTTGPDRTFTATTSLETCFFRAISRGASAHGSVAKFYRCGQLLYEKTGGGGGGRGFNVAAFDRNTGELIQPVQNFDTWGTRTSGVAMNQMIAFLDSLPSGTLVLIGVADEAGLNPSGGSCAFTSFSWTEAGLRKLEEMGSSQIRNYCYWDSWSMVFVKGEANARSEQLGKGREAAVSHILTFPAFALSAVSISSVQSTTASIAWITNELADSLVEFGPTTAYGQSTVNANLVTTHTVNLEGLPPNTTLHFRVKSTDGVGNLVVSEDRTLTTPPMVPSIRLLTDSTPGLSQILAPLFGNGFTLTVTGQNFVNGAVVKMGDSNLPTTFVDSSKLTAVVQAAELMTRGAFPIKVTNPGPADSNVLDLKVLERADLNGSGSVNIGDALVCALSVGGLLTPPLSNDVGDVNLNGSTNIGDCLVLALFSGRVSVNLPTPNVTSHSPLEAMKGEIVTISGTGFSAAPDNNQVLFATESGSGIRVIPPSSTSNSITVIVPAEAISGMLQVSRIDVPMGGNEYPLRLAGSQSPLMLASVSPFFNVQPGGSVVLSGLGFSNTLLDNHVLFTSASGTTQATVTAASETSLTATVPVSAACGPVSVRFGTQTTQSRIVRVAGATCDLQLTGFLGKSSPGDTIVLEGAGFDVVSPANNIVKFAAIGGGTVNATVMQAGGTQLQVHVPENAAEGGVTVAVGSAMSNTLIYRPQ